MHDETTRMLENTTAIVTGASSGIGRAVAEAYARQGARVILVGRDPAKLAGVTRSLAAGDRAAVIAGDVGDMRTIDRAFELARDRFSGVDVLVNVAGIFESRPLAQYSAHDVGRFVHTNLLAVFLACQAAVAEFRRRRVEGAIVNVSSAISIRPMQRLPASIPNAIKAAVTGFTKSLAIELAAERIRVNAVAPGVIKTPLLGADPDDPALLADQPLQRLGEPEDVADAILYLAGARYVTGVVLPVDGGMTAGR